MISVLLECQDQDQDLVQTLSVLVSGAVEGLVSEVIVLGAGASEPVRRICDSAGCRLHEGPVDAALIGGARGRWLLFVACGARPQPGWIESLGDYCQAFSAPARFSPARAFRLPLWKRLLARREAFDLGLLIRRDEAMARLAAGGSLTALAASRLRSLGAELVPAAVLRAERAASGLRPAAAL